MRELDNMFSTTVHIHMLHVMITIGYSYFSALLINVINIYSYFTNKKKLIKANHKVLESYRY